MDSMLATLHVSAAGMNTQGTRLRIIAENLANADSLPTAAGEEPYRRRVVQFRNVLDHELGVETVQTDRIRTDSTPYARKFDPGHPAADAAGYVSTPNVDPLIEMADMREAQRSYEANLNAIRTAKSMLQDTLDLLR